MTGRELRLRSILRKSDGRAVVVALDHGGIAGPLPGIEDPAAVVRACVEGGADAIMATRGIVKASLAEWNRSTSLILRLTGGFTLLGGGFEEELISEPETALAYGASACALTVKFGHAREGDFIRQASLAIDRCERLGLPVLIEAMARGEGRKANDPASIRLAARAAQEIGADLVKTYYTGDRESFREVTRGCPAPVLILGGESEAGPEALFAEVRASLEAGGAGVAIGRNVWSGGRTRAMVEALVGMVHEGWTSAQALAHLG
jgi:DhnA family fructose-bisphosphate aldolase class Ia